MNPALLWLAVMLAGVARAQEEPSITFGDSPASDAQATGAAGEGETVDLRHHWKRPYSYGYGYGHASSSYYPSYYGNYGGAYHHYHYPQNYVQPAAYYYPATSYGYGGHNYGYSNHYSSSYQQSYSSSSSSGGGGFYGHHGLGYREGNKDDKTAAATPSGDDTIQFH